MKHLSDKHFSRKFRLSRRAFNALLEKLQDEMGDCFEGDIHIRKATASSGSHTCSFSTVPSFLGCNYSDNRFDDRLAATLRFLALVTILISVLSLEL